MRYSSALDTTRLTDTISSGLVSRAGVAAHSLHAEVSRHGYAFTACGGEMLVKYSFASQPFFLPMRTCAYSTPVSVEE